MLIHWLLKKNIDLLELEQYSAGVDTQASDAIRDWLFTSWMVLIPCLISCYGCTHQVLLLQTSVEPREKLPQNTDELGNKDID